MSTRSYRGNRGKNVYEIANFSKGVNATNAAMPPGYLKELVNMNISPDGLSLRPREPYLNYALYLIEQDEFVSFSNQVGMFISKQFPNWEFIIDFFGKRYGYEKVIEDYRIIDGDTFEDNKTGTRYRLLIVDAYELGTEEGKQAKEYLENLTDGKPIIVRYDSQAPSWVDKYNRHLVWAYTTLAGTTKGLNIQKELIVKKRAKYLDLRVTEHEDNILTTEFSDLEDYKGYTMIVEDYPGGIPVVYRRNINQPPELIEGRPSYILYEFNNIFMGDMLNDLEMGYSFVPDIKINKVNSEFGRYRTEYNPLEQNKMTNHDGIVSLVDINLRPPVDEAIFYPIRIQINNGEWESYRVTNDYVNHYNDVAIRINYTNPVLYIHGVVGINGFMSGDIVKIDTRGWANKVRVMNHQMEMSELDGVSPNFEIRVGANNAYIMELGSTLGNGEEDAYQDIGLIKRLNE